MKYIGVGVCGKYDNRDYDITSELKPCKVYDDGKFFIVSYRDDSLNSTKNYRDTGINAGFWKVSPEHVILGVPNNPLSKAVYPNYIESDCKKFLVPKESECL